MTEDEIIGWHHRLNGHEFEQTLGVGEGPGSLVCCSPWGHKESDTTEGLNLITYLLNMVSSECVLSPVLFFETPWTVAHQAPLSMGFFRQEYWSELPFSCSGGSFQPTEPRSLVSLALHVDSLPTEPSGKPT